MTRLLLAAFLAGLLAGLTAHLALGYLRELPMSDADFRAFLGSVGIRDDDAGITYAGGGG